jgi:hypothetical protein
MENNIEALLEKILETNGLDGNYSLDTLGFAVSILAAAIFGYMLKILYELYFQDNEPQDGSLARSMVLLTPALTATFWMIQNSLVLSLGLLGSLSFVRFRTPIKRSEDISFIVILLAVSISCAVGSFIIAIMLLTLLFLYSAARNHSLNLFAKKSRFAIITFNTKKTNSVAEITSLFKEKGVKADFVSSRTYDGITSFVFNASAVTPEAHDEVTTLLCSYDEKSHVNIFYPNERLGV